MASLAWLIAPLLAVLFVWWNAAERTRRIETVSALTAGAPVDAGTATGYARGMRSLVLPDRDPTGYEWIMQTQQLHAQGEWRVRQVGYDNAPAGRVVRSGSPYRWWLATVAWWDRVTAGTPAGVAIERAALSANPALQILLLCAAALGVARVFGTFSGGVVAIGLAALFPLGGVLPPGLPQDTGLEIAGILAGVLLLLAGLRPTLRPETPPDPRTTRRWFIAAGIAGGLGLWINVASQLAVLGGIFIGGLVLAGMARRDRAMSAASPPWRAWAISGALASVAAYLVEYLPSHLGGLHLANNHPLYALAWLGAGELLMLATARNELPPAARSWLRHLRLALALAAVVAVPVIMVLTKTPAFRSAAPAVSQLNPLPGAVTADTLLAWLARDGLSAPFWAAFLPLLVLVPAGWLLTRRAPDGGVKRMVALALGPVAVLLVLACFNLGWWSLLDAALLALLVALGAALTSGLGRALAAAGLAVALTPGVLLLIPRAEAARASAVTETEVAALMERDLAHWLALRSPQPGAIVLAPPGLTATLGYYGGLRGLGSPYPGNDEGFAAAVRIAAAISADEAQALAQRRELAYIVMPSWDTYLDDYARLGTETPEKSLIGLLHQWQAPRWLRPIPYQVPRIPGFEGRTVAVFQVVEPQDNATALSRLAEYFIEMEMPEPAAAVVVALRQSFAAELAALAGRAQVEIAFGDTAALAKTVAAILPALAGGAESFLPWDRRVSLALVLAQARHPEEARAQMQRCLAAADEDRLRTLTPVSLYRLLLVSRAYDLALPDPAAHATALELLPAEWRAKL